MRLSITGVNHNTAPVEVRERLAFDAHSLPAVISELKSVPGMIEGVILSTCNRVEIAVTSEDAINTHETVAGFLAKSRQVENSWIRQFLYHYEDRDAIRHLFRVASSLDSMVIGEPQILGQLKDAYETAKSQGALAGFLDHVLTRAFSVAKRVRTETEVGHSAVSISYAAVELAKQIFGSLKGKRVLLIGAGKMSELAARHLERSGIGEILVTNRSAERARQMADLFNNARIADYNTFTNDLASVDVVIASSGASHYVLNKEDMQRVMHARRNRAMFLIDIAVPRNIDPAVNDLEGAFLYDIDDLQKAVEQNKKGREKQAEEAEKIVDGEVERTLARLKGREVTPMIVGIQQQLETIRSEEMERYRSKLGALTPQQEEALDAITRGIVNKVAHAPITELRRIAANPNNTSAMELIRRLFRLD